MIPITNATLCWRADNVWIEAGDVGPVLGVSMQPIDSVQSAMAAAWLAVTGVGLPVTDVHAALLVWTAIGKPRQSRNSYAARLRVFWRGRSARCSCLSKYW